MSKEKNDNIIYPPDEIVVDHEERKTFFEYVIYRIKTPVRVLKRFYARIRNSFFRYYNALDHRPRVLRPNEMRTDYMLLHRNNARDTVRSQKKVNNELEWRPREYESTASEVSIVMISFNNPDLTKRAIDSIFNTKTDIRFQLIVLDNGSDRATLRMLHDYIARRYHSVKIIYNRQNVNFSLGNNIAFQFVKSLHTIFINNDTYVTDYWIDNLLKAKKDDTKVNAVQPLLLYPDETVQNIGIVFSEYSAVGYPYYVGVPRGRTDIIKSRHIQAATAACVLVSSHDFNSIKGFDPSYINGQEDVDLCLRLNSLHEGSCYVNTSAVVFHDESKSKGRGRYIKPNRSVFIKRWANDIRPDDMSIFNEDGLSIKGWVIDNEDNRSEGIACFTPVFYDDITAPLHK